MQMGMVLLAALLAVVVVVVMVAGWEGLGLGCVSSETVVVR